MRTGDRPAGANPIQSYFKHLVTRHFFLALAIVIAAVIVTPRFSVHAQESVDSVELSADSTVDSTSTTAVSDKDTSGVDEKGAVSVAVTENTENNENSAEGGVDSEAGVFNNKRWYAFGFVVFFSVVLFFYTRQARSGKKMFIRKIPGLEAVEEAVGRATEMGRTVLFIPGIQELDDIQTIAGLTILGRVAKITAEYETPLMVPVRYPLIYAGAQEMVEQSYSEVGRKDSYNQDIVRYVAGEQFAFTAHVNGWMVREKPAANIYMGGFFAESLLLAETGFAAGAIQIAGTAEVAQLPFFIAACDYTLIGEELYAGSAYLSHEPLMLGGLKGQDFVKVFLILCIFVGVAGVIFWPDSLGETLKNIWTAP